jgi:mediator of RNA polymerase II transcription subunit 12
LVLPSWIDGFNSYGIVSADIPSSWQNLSAMLSPWKLGATAIVLQFVLKQMGRDLSQEATRQAASARLDELMFNIFHHCMTSEESSFVAEMASGVGSEVAGKVRYGNY